MVCVSRRVAVKWSVTLAYSSELRVPLALSLLSASARTLPSRVRGLLLSCPASAAGPCCAHAARTPAHAHYAQVSIAYARLLSSSDAAAHATML